MADVQELVKTVIQVLNDGSTGFAEIGEHMKSTELKSFFMTESQIRATFARAVAAAAGVSSEEAGGTAGGAIHRTWGDLKAKLGGGDHTLLETAEQGEDAAKKAYKKALEDSSLRQASVPSCSNSTRRRTTRSKPSATAQPANSP